MPSLPTSQSLGRGGAIAEAFKVSSGNPGAETIQRADRDFHARRILINSSNPLTKYSLLEIQDDAGILDADMSLIQAGTIAAPGGNEATVNMLTSRGTIGAPITVIADDLLGQYTWKGWNGTGYSAAVVMEVEVETQIGTTVSGQWTLYCRTRETGEPALDGAIQVRANSALDDSLIISVAPSVTDEFQVYGQEISAYIASVAPSISVTTQKLVASGTYTPTAGMKFCWVRMVGGGGGGGGADSDGAAKPGAGGGGAGEYAEGLFTAAEIGASKAFTIGAAGSAGSNTGGDGGVGGTTSITTLITAVGGSGGVGTGSAATTNEPRAGGVGGTGGTVKDVNAPGETGDPSFTDGAVIGGRGGKGASGPFGAGGVGGILDAVGADATGKGAGGGGAAEDDVTGRAGGAGTIGYIIIMEFA